MKCTVVSDQSVYYRDIALILVSIDLRLHTDFFYLFRFVTQMNTRVRVGIGYASVKVG